MSGVEPYARERICDLRETLSETCQELWQKDAKGDSDKAIPLPSIGGLPDGSGPNGLRPLLKQAPELNPSHNPSFSWGRAGGSEKLNMHFFVVQGKQFKVLRPRGLSHV